MEEQKQDKFDMDAGAYKLAINTVIQVLVEQVSGADSELRGRISSEMDAYITQLNPQSEREEDFAERARGYVALLVRSTS